MKRSLRHYINALVAYSFRVVFSSGPSSGKNKSELEKFQRRTGLINAWDGVGSH